MIGGNKMTSEEFYERMKAIRETSGSVIEMFSCAHNLMSQALKEEGYGKGIEIYEAERERLLESRITYERWRDRGRITEIK